MPMFVLILVRLSDLYLSLFCNFPVLALQLYALLDQSSEKTGSIWHFCHWIITTTIVIRCTYHEFHKTGHFHPYEVMPPHRGQSGLILEMEERTTFGKVSIWPWPWDDGVNMLLANFYSQQNHIGKFTNIVFCSMINFDLWNLDSDLYRDLGTPRNTMKQKRYLQQKRNCIKLYDPKTSRLD